MDFRYEKRAMGGETMTKAIWRPSLALGAFVAGMVLMGGVFGLPTAVVCYEIAGAGGVCIGWAAANWACGME